ncbi:MAG: hypothetical protein IJC63_07825 [Myxococcaceae bacterium]|nr:hypothetical protein [Myxococcaceae bacterium]
MNLKTTFSALCVTMALASGAMAAPPHPPPGPPPGAPGCAPSSEVLALRQEIAAIKLDLALALSAEQARAIHAIALQAQARKDAIEAEKESRESLLIAAMTAARDDLKRDGKVSEATAQKLLQARGKSDFRAIHEEFESMRAQVDAILTDAQREAFATFDPRPLSNDRPPRPPPPPPGAWHGSHPPPPPLDGWHEGPPPPGDTRPPPRHHRQARASMMLLSEEFIPFLEARMK